jgi:hypothetical protein
MEPCLELHGLRRSTDAQYQQHHNGDPHHPRAGSLDELTPSDLPDSASCAHAETASRKVDQGVGYVEGKVRAGTLNMNRARLTISVTGIEAGITQLVFQAVAEEGLIQQHTSEGAIERVLGALQIVNP